MPNSCGRGEQGARSSMGRRPGAAAVSARGRRGDWKSAERYPARAMTPTSQAGTAIRSAAEAVLVGVGEKGEGAGSHTVARTDFLSFLRSKRREPINLGGNSAAGEGGLQLSRAGPRLPTIPRIFRRSPSSSPRHLGDSTLHARSPSSPGKAAISLVRCTWSFAPAVAGLWTSPTARRPLREGAGSRRGALPRWRSPHVLARGGSRIALALPKTLRHAAANANQALPSPHQSPDRTRLVMSAQHNAPLRRRGRSGGRHLTRR